MTIKLFIDHDLDRSGKGKFLQRLKPELEELGVIITNYKKSNVVLGINRYYNYKKNDSKKYVMRLDGMHLVKNKRNMWINSVVKNCCAKSNAIIYQSKFSKEMWKSIYKTKAKKEYTILNGANPSDYDVTPAYSSYPKNVLMCARWLKPRTHKRLKTMLKIAHEYAEENNDVRFIVAGDYYIKEPDSKHIKMLGRISEVELQGYMKLCDCMLNIAWYDWCPNAVVEAVCAGLPVICGNNGGIHEIVGPSNGFVINIDKEMNRKLLKNNKPPDIDVGLVHDTLKVVLNNEWNIKNDHVYIKNTVKKYYNVFRDVLNER